MSSSPAKRGKFTNRSKGYFAGQAKKNNRSSIEVGDKGFLVTCNFRERDSIREVYHLLNTYHKKLTDDESPESQNKLPVKGESNPEDDDLDVEDELKRDIEKTKKENEAKTHLFNYIDTGVQNLLFIRTTVDDPQKLATAIVRDLFTTKTKKTKVTLRFLPVQSVCKAKIEDVTNAAGLLFDRYFLKKPSTFGINFNKRYNDNIQRDEVIRELAELVQMKNPLNKVNLKEPQLSIIVEIIKGYCLLSVVPDYLKMKKYNLHELWEKNFNSEDAKEEEDSEKTVETETEKTEKIEKGDLNP